MTRGALGERRTRARVEALLAGIESPSVEVADDADARALLEALGPRRSLRRRGLDGRGRVKDLVVLRRLDGDEEVFPGYSWRELRDGRRERRLGVLCQTGVEVQSVVGCPFDCTYCPYGSFVCIGVDVESFVERVADLAAARPAQALYKLNNRTDTLGLEPEYGLARALVERFARLEGKHLLLYTKGDEVEQLAGLEHRGKTIASFTLTPEPVAALLEPGAPPPAARIAALGRLAAAGYPVRVRFSPIVPLRGWREAYRDLVARVAAVARPELFTLWTLSMIDAGELTRIVPADALDPEMLGAAHGATDRMRGKKGAPFPPEERIALYRALAEGVHAALPEARVALCLETPEVWDALGDALTPRRGARFLCNCGPRATRIPPR